MPVTETGTRARQPDSSGYATTDDGLRLYYEVFGNGRRRRSSFMPGHPDLALAPVEGRRSTTWRGTSGSSSTTGAATACPTIPTRRQDGSASAARDDCLAVMDATGTEAAVLVGICHDGVFPSIAAGGLPIRSASSASSPSAPACRWSARHSNSALRRVAVFDQVLESNEGWFKYNEHYIRQNYRGFLEFFFGEMFPEPHSTKQIEDAVAYGLDGRAETLLMDDERPSPTTREEVEAICRQVRCPVLIIQGDQDNCQPFERGVRWPS